MSSQTQSVFPPYKPLATIGAIAARNGVRTHRVLYVIRSLGIRAQHRAGIARVFDDAQVKAIERELERINGQREGVFTK
jgi:hypothetical protein